MSVRVVCHKPIGNGISFVATRCWRAKMINTRNDFSHWKQFFSLFVRFIHVVCRWCPLATLSTPPSERTKSISHRKTLNAMKFSCSHSVVWFSHKLKRMLTSGVRDRWKRENRHTLNLLKWNKQDNDESNLSISRRMRRDTAEWERAKMHGQHNRIRNKIVAVSFPLCSIDVKNFRHRLIYNFILIATQIVSISSSYRFQFARSPHSLASRSNREREKKMRQRKVDLR